MNKRHYLIISVLMMFIISSFVYTPAVKAADEYEFEISYTGSVTVNEEKQANVILRGTDATTYQKVQIKVDIDGPSTPKILAIDSSGVEHDIAKLGYWGPETGFAVGGTFENVTPIKATFPSAGTYEITLTLINLDANNSPITSRVTTIEVLEDGSNVSNEIVNTVGNVTNNEIEKLPQTGTSIIEYIIYTGIIIIAISYGYMKIRKAQA